MTSSHDSSTKSPRAKSVEVFRLDGEGYRFVGASGGTDVVRLEPFDAIELELGALWR